MTILINSRTLIYLLKAGISLINDILMDGTEYSFVQTNLETQKNKRTKTGTNDTKKMSQNNGSHRPFNNPDFNFRKSSMYKIHPGLSFFHREYVVTSLKVVMT